MMHIELQPREALTKRYSVKRVLKGFAKFTRKLLCQSLFFNKVARPQCATLLKLRLWHRCFHVNFAKSLRTPLYIDNLWWLDLSLGRSYCL